MRMTAVNELLQQSRQLMSDYEKHFNTPFPQRIVGWWNPLNITDHPDELKQGVQQMTKDIQKAIQTNEPIVEIPEDQWVKMIF